MSDDREYMPFLAEARLGDRVAMGSLARMVWDRVYSFAFRTTLDHNEAEDGPRDLPELRPRPVGGSREMPSLRQPVARARADPARLARDRPAGRPGLQRSRPSAGGDNLIEV